MSSELSREEAIVAAAYINGIYATPPGEYAWERARSRAKECVSSAPPDIRSALSGGGGGETAENLSVSSLDGRRGNAYFWRDAAEVAEAKLAAAEKRAEEAERNAVARADSYTCGGCKAVFWSYQEREDHIHICEQHPFAGQRRAERERDALKAELAQYKSHHQFNCYEAIVRERDSCLDKFDALKSEARQNDLEYVALFNAQAKEIDALRAELAEVKVERDKYLAELERPRKSLSEIFHGAGIWNAAMVESLVRRDARLRSERDAALARVNRLEESGTLTSSSGESGGVTYWFEKYAAAAKALATIRAAAGAQP